jgi:hypothetical protein
LKEIVEKFERFFPFSNPESDGNTKFFDDISLQIEVATGLQEKNDNILESL